MNRVAIGATAVLVASLLAGPSLVSKSSFFVAFTSAGQQHKGTITLLEGKRGTYKGTYGNNAQVIEDLTLGQMTDGTPVFIGSNPRDAQQQRIAGYEADAFVRAKAWMHCKVAALQKNDIKGCSPVQVTEEKQQ